jgi:hypothetical protein
MVTGTKMTVYLSEKRIKTLKKMAAEEGITIISTRDLIWFSRFAFYRVIDSK